MIRIPIRQILRVAAIVWMVVASAGCVSDQRASGPSSLWHARTFHLSMPSEPFDGYEAAFRHIAKCEGLGADSHTLFALSADSTLERSHSHLTGDLVVVRADYYGHSRFGIRGAQGQGRYYAFQVTGREWKLVGVFHGNRLRWEGIGDKIRVFVHWHTSAFDDPADDTAYVWNGQFFECENSEERSRQINTEVDK